MSQGRSALLLLRQPQGLAMTGRKEELVELARGIGITTVAVLSLRSNMPHSTTFAGKGKVEEIAALLAAKEIDLLLVSDDLSPLQERNLERLIGRSVLDRQGLILQVFAARARSFASRLQVELAQLRHTSSRLVRGWSHLERQKGGIGMRGGPGEKQLETDRRLINQRMRTIRQRLTKLQTQRRQGRKRRHDLPLISLVGYTNVGKSTLFNRLTRADMGVADRPFETLDTTIRRLSLPCGQDILLGDTVGFIDALPEHLLDSFCTTLEEACDSDLLLHVIDASDPQRVARIEVVERVLEHIGAGSIPRFEIFNKIDRIDRQAGVEQIPGSSCPRIWLSAQANEGLEQLRDCLREHFSARRLRRWLWLPAVAWALRVQLYRLRAVAQEHAGDDGSCWLQLDMESVHWKRLTADPQWRMLLADSAPTIPCPVAPVGLE